MSGGDGYSWVGWLLVILGWWIVNTTANRRETRKEARSAVDQAKKDTMALAKTAIAYFSDPAARTEDEIKSGLELLEVELERLRHYESSQIRNRFAEFHENCTGADFESAGRAAHSANSAVVQGIIFTRNRLVSELERHFRAEYTDPLI